MADAAGDAPRVGSDAFVGVVCPLLVIAWSADDQPARVGGQGGPGADPTNRCAASDPPASLSMTQQRLVCLDAAHVDCPRFVRAMGPGRGGSGRLGRSASARGGSPAGTGSASTRRADRRSGPGEAAESAVPAGVAAGLAGAGSAGAAGGLAGAAGSLAGPAAGSATAGPELATTPVRGAAVEAAPAPVEPLAPIVPVAPHLRSSRRSGARPARSRPGPLVVAGGILVAALIVALAFTSIRGGLTLPGGAPGLGTASPSPSAAVSPSPTLAPSPTLGPSPTPTAAPTPSPTPSPMPSPSVAASPSGTPQPSLPPAFVGLKPCTDAPDCYLYRVRSGDNLTQIAQHFGVTKAAIKSLNPEITDPSLIHVGDMIRIPLPTG